MAWNQSLHAQIKNMITKYIKQLQKHPQYHISLYIIIPFIYAGFTILAAIVAYSLTRYDLIHGIGFKNSVFWATALVGFFASLAGFALVRLMLKPMEKFVEKAKNLPNISSTENQKERDRSLDQMQKFTNVFNQVTNVLSKIDARYYFPEIIGESLAMRSLLSLIMKVAPTDSTVLILGESGTGKELVATSIHEQSLRKDKPFIKLNCAAIPEELLESELFGHEKGAFTGATTSKRGKFDMANGGTIFLDEIGDMPFNLQAKILRVIQEREFYRVGGTRTIKVDVRFIASTNQNLEQMVKEGSFREDLFYRLNVFSLHLPPLRERKEDVPLIVDHFLEKSSKPVEISSTALQILITNSWPGNIRELQNTIERASVICDGEFIEPEHLPPSITGAFINNSEELPSLPANAPLDHRLMEIEKGMIIEALRKTGGIQIRATELLGINQRSLWHRIKKHNIDVKNIKNDNI
ncbi:MAG: sigma-54-dependent Fis family transcriptional regulator [Deltaproteobacteria bacterium]|nr:sigma-54-dependent Fis family transcriptional regulator [Deltaproteobacteria bacterium]